jgi:hypothetical protein
MTQFRCWSCLVLAGLLLFGAVGACAPQPASSGPTPLATRLPVSGTPTAVPTLLPGAAESRDDSAADTAKPGADRETSGTAAPANVRYVVDATLNWTTKTIHVKQKVSYVNDSGVSQP